MTHTLDEIWDKIDRLQVGDFLTKKALAEFREELICILAKRGEVSKANLKVLSGFEPE